MKQIKKFMANIKRFEDFIINERAPYDFYQGDRRSQLKWTEAEMDDLEQIGGKIHNNENGAMISYNAKEPGDWLEKDAPFTIFIQKVTGKEAGSSEKEYGYKVAFNKSPKDLGIIGEKWGTVSGTCAYHLHWRETLNKINYIFRKVRERDFEERRQAEKAAKKLVDKKDAPAWWEIS